MVSKLVLLFLFVVIILLFLQIRNRFMTPRKFTLLALGDSYTIGEGVEEAGNFPTQTVSFLQKSGFVFESPDILAKTGWTSQDLLNAVKTTQLRDNYHIVTLLIGVNNQYQGLNVHDYEVSFEKLVKIAIQFAYNNNERVYVLSIPDWGQTPFAEDRNTQTISREIEAFNRINHRIAEAYRVNYISTALDSIESHDPINLTADHLHPSPRVYAGWARLLTEKIQKQLV